MIRVPEYWSGSQALSRGVARDVMALLTTFVVTASLAAEPQARTIRIVSGTYGQNCGAPHGNATDDVAHRCDGRTTCETTPRVTRKDRVEASCSRDFVVEWRCDDADFHTAALGPAAGADDTLVLSCVSERGAGK
jgi:hypothetical protein